MRKWLILLVIAFLFQFEKVYSQEDFNSLNKSNSYLGASIRGGFIHDWQFIGGFTLRGHYFFFDRFSAGIDAGYMQNRSLYHHYEGGISGRYYLLNRKFAPIVETSYIHFWASNKGTVVKNFQWDEIKLGAGIAATRLIKDRLGMDALIEYPIYLNINPYNSAKPNLRIQFTYFF